MRESITVSSTQVIKVALAELYPNYDPQTAKLGKETHRRIEGEIRLVLGDSLPGFRNNDSPRLVETEKQVIKPLIQNQLYLTATLDGLVDDKLVVEIKPNLQHHHAVQLMINCLAADKKDDGVAGVLYCYTKGSMHLLEQGGKQHWENGKKLCLFAHQLLSLQRQMDIINMQSKLSKKRFQGQYTLQGLNYGESDTPTLEELAQASAEARAEFDNLFRITSQALMNELTRCELVS